MTMQREGVPMTVSDSATQARVYGHFIAGAWTDGAERIERFSPSSGELTATYAAGAAADVDRAVQAARAAFDSGAWSSLPGAERGRLLSAVAARIRDEAERLARIEVAETGKTIRTARADLLGAAGHFDNAAGLAWQLKGESHDNLGPHLSAVNVREPVGVAGLIIPWNFPALILAQKLPYALAAGCTAVIKPAETTSGTACEIVAICDEAGIPAGVVNLITGYGTVAGQALTEHHDVDYVSFTGSTASGRRVVEASAGNLKRLALELGGKASTIVFADADLDDAVDAALFAITFNQGECCVSGTRLLIQESVAGDFLAELVRRAAQLKVGDPFDESTDIGALIHGNHLAQVLKYVEHGVEDGATILTGGSQLTTGGRDAGYYVEPTIFDDVAPDARIFQEEIFGPVLAVTRFGSLEEAIALANNSVYGLANSVWTKNIDTAHRVSRALRSGTVWINTTIDGAPQLPLGGYKQSGYGREAGQHGMEEFTNVKSIQTRIGKRTPAYPPMT
jgi:betaine-aldehyde dehydrogenase